MYWMIIIVLTLLSVIVSSRLTSKFKEYSKIKLQGNLTGKDIAEMMLKNHDIIDVSVQCTEGHLTDHYNPTDKVINLSKEVYYGNHIAAAAVAHAPVPQAIVTPLPRSHTRIRNVCSSITSTNSTLTPPGKAL